MASIFTLPPEILSEIAIFVAHEEFTPPVRLMLASKTWSEVVLSTPSAFSALSIECASDPSDPCIPVISHWVERSGVSPLYITLDFRWTDHMAVPLLLPTSALYKRHKDIQELYIHHASAWNLWNLDCLWPAPSLRSLHISHNTSIFGAHLELLEFPLFLRNTMQAPRLRTLELNHCRFDRPASDLTALEELEASSCVVTGDGLRSMLHSCPNLRRLAFKDVSVGDWNSATPAEDYIRDVVLEHIWSMKLYLHGSLSILRGISTPALTHLTLSYVGLDNQTLKYIVDFISQERIQLRYLGLTLISGSIHSVLILPELAHLETLHVIIRDINYHPSAVLKHPSLTEFKLHYEPCPSNIAAWNELFSYQDRFIVEYSLFREQ